MNYIAYYRVSTARQGVSGLGLEAQQEAVARYLSTAGGVALDSFVEVESGKKKNRVELGRAIAACKKHKAILIIAKLDRLARNVHFISGLMEGGVEFVAVDNPHANRLMLHMLAAFAEHEREQISKRTKEALAAAKARGVRLGRNGTKLASENRRRASDFAKAILPSIQEIKGRGIDSLSSIARELNDMGIHTREGGQWHPMSVSRVLRHA
ncbi:recombinase family protein [Ruficoccus sp. ZRK36]|uniref:recombinase family protein n=1 Tax=Ruficoccus sp. ZRK36 TaxID=2866311 RepID=UPI001C72BD91|nr:recombinase family protein [Ruficoccus sp. ZRK36]QYY37509.1 recombinase family protein [Ruficoccus sp. ZRK36]